MDDLKTDAMNFRPAIVAPTFNNGGTLNEVLQQLASFQIPIFVVNDGSTDETQRNLTAWASAHPDHHVLTHENNLGKAAALQRGFAACRLAGFTHAVTVDTDGQHSPADIPRLLAVAVTNPSAIVLGARDEQCETYPCRSRWGRRISNLAVRLECGERVEDSQCGLRVYPLAEIARIRCSASHYGYETEIITRAAWKHLKIVSVRVTCLYLPADQRVSHFRPWLDSARALAMHGRLLIISMRPWRSGSGDRAELFSITQWRRSFRQSVRGINPLLAWRSMRQDEIGRTDLAMGFALGVFIANLPLYGFQTLLGMFTAKRLHLNPFSVVAGTQASMPPIGPVLIAAAICVGHLILHGAIPTWSVVQSHLHGHVAGLVGSVLLDWIVGSVCVGGVLAVVAFLVLRFALRAAFRRQLTSEQRWPAGETSIVGSTE